MQLKLQLKLYIFKLFDCFWWHVEPFRVILWVDVMEQRLLNIYNSKYSYLIQIISTQLYSFKYSSYNNHLHKKKMNIEMLKRIMSEKTRLPSLWNQVKVENETKKKKANYEHISTNNYGIKRTNPCRSEISLWKKSVSLKNMNGNLKPGWEIWLEMQTTSKNDKTGRTLEHVGTKKKKVTQIKQTIQLKEIN